MWLFILLLLLPKCIRVWISDARKSKLGTFSLGDRPKLLPWSSNVEHYILTENIFLYLGSVIISPERIFLRGNFVALLTFLLHCAPSPVFSTVSVHKCALVLTERLTTSVHPPKFVSTVSVQCTLFTIPRCCCHRPATLCLWSDRGHLQQWPVY